MDRIGEDFLPHVEVVPVAGRCAVQLTSSSGNAFFQAAEWRWRVRARAARHPGPGVLTARSKTLPPLQVRNSAQYGYGVLVHQRHDFRCAHHQRHANEDHHCVGRVVG
jgi:hypothetical protein